MLYIFNVVTGSMITLDMDLTLHKVEKLKAAIYRQTGTSSEKQVLLVSGGEALELDQDVGNYTAGTDTNPIFFFPISIIESEVLPKVQMDLQQDIEVKEHIEESKKLAASYSTVVARAQLAQKVFEYSREQMALCKKIVHFQHLQQLGWAAAVANLEDTLVLIHRHFDVFAKAFAEHLQLRDFRLELLNNFPEDLQLLQKIPLLPALCESPTCDVFVDEAVIVDALLCDQECTNVQRNEATASKRRMSSVSLLDWMLPRGLHDENFPIEDYKSRLLKLDSSFMLTVEQDYSAILSEASKPDLKEIKGLEDRLCGLESLMRDGTKYVSEQKNFAESFLYNQNRSMTVKDDSVYPNLCSSQIPNLDQMNSLYQKIRDIRKRCMKAREELSLNIIHRLKWILFVENKIHELLGRLYIFRENMKRIDAHMEIIEQIHKTPKLYFKAVAEILRRQLFKERFIRWANELSGECKAIWDKEVAKREAFLEDISLHFLKDLFPGLNDLPPAFATERPILFDEGLPKLPWEALEILLEAVPEICTDFAFDACDAVPDIILKGLSRDQPESETDTEEFEKVPGSVSDGPHSPLEVVNEGQLECDRTASTLKMRTKRNELKSVSPFADGLPDFSAVDSGQVMITCRLSKELRKDALSSFPSKNQVCLESDSDDVSCKDFFGMLQREILFILQQAKEGGNSELVTISRNLLSALNKRPSFEVEDREEEIQRLQVVVESSKKSLDEAQQKFSEETSEKLNKLTLEHEIEMETLKETLGKESETRLNEIVAVKQNLNDATDCVRQLKEEKECLMGQLENLKASFSGKEAKAKEVEDVTRLLREEFEEEEKRLVEAHREELKMAMSDLRLSLETEGEERLEELRKKMEDEYSFELRKCRELWEAQKEEHVEEKLMELASRLTCEHESELDRVRQSRQSELDKAKLKYKMDVQGLISRFRIVTMDKIPSEALLDKIDKGDVLEVSAHEAALNALRKEYQRERELLLEGQKRELEGKFEDILELERRRNEERLEEQNKRIEEEKQVLFNAAVKEVTLDKERVIENLRLKVEFLSEENEKLMQVAIKHAEDESNLQGSSSESRSTAAENLQQIARQISSAESSQTSESLLEQLRKLESENKILKHDLSFHSSDQYRITLSSCQPFDNVLIVWDDQYSHYRVHLEGFSTVHFLHSDCYRALGLCKDEPRKLFCIAQVIKKEFCQAKKDENRFRVPKGTKFYRVVVQPFGTEGGRQKKGSMVGSPPKLQRPKTGSDESPKPDRVSRSQSSIPDRAMSVSAFDPGKVSDGVEAREARGCRREVFVSSRQLGESS